MTSLPKLLSCPFCGGNVEFHVGHHNFTDVLVHCVECDVEGPLFDKFDGKYDVEEDEAIHQNQLDAVEHWNKRVQS